MALVQNAWLQWVTMQKFGIPQAQADQWLRGKALEIQQAAQDQQNAIAAGNLTGRYGGENTLARDIYATDVTNANRNFGLQAAGLAGYTVNPDGTVNTSAPSLARDTLNQNTALRAGEITGTYGGQETLASKLGLGDLALRQLQNAQQFGLNQGQLLGSYQGADTLERQRMLRDDAFRQAQALGVMNGQDTLERQRFLDDQQRYLANLRANPGTFAESVLAEGSRSQMGAPQYAPYTQTGPITGALRPDTFAPAGATGGTTPPGTVPTAPDDQVVDRLVQGAIGMIKTGAQSGGVAAMVQGPRPTEPGINQQVWDRYHQLTGGQNMQALTAFNQAQAPAQPQYVMDVQRQTAAPDVASQMAQQMALRPDQQALAAAARAVQARASVTPAGTAGVDPRVEAVRQSSFYKNIVGNAPQVQREAALPGVVQGRRMNRLAYQNVSGDQRAIYNSLQRAQGLNPQDEEAELRRYTPTAGRGVVVGLRSR